MFPPVQTYPILKRGVWCVLFLVAAAVFADTWAAPTAFETASSNGKYIGHVEPGETFRADRRPTLEVFKLDGGKRISHWRGQLVNEISPVEIVITDDGQFVITLDNHHHVGYGEDVVAIYAQRGLIRKYSLEAVFAEVPTPRDGGYWNLFSHSVSSRWWRDSSIKLIAGEGAEARFGIWLDWAKRWFVWQLADGTMVKLNKDVARQWDVMGRQWGLVQLGTAEAAGVGAGRGMPAENGAAYHTQVTACRYLGYAKNPMDRKLLERLLYRLGTVKVDIQLPHMPAKKEGQMYLSIFSDAVKPDAWREGRPAFRGGHHFGRSIENRPVAIEIPPLKPGRYWVKVVWDRKPPFEFNLYVYDGMTGWKESRAPAPAAGADDFESKAETFEVKAGKTVEIKVACDRPGAKQ